MTRLIVSVLLFMVSSSFALFGSEHPRLLFTAKEIPAIKEFARTETGKQMVDTLRWQVKNPIQGFLKQERELLKSGGKHKIGADVICRYANFAAILYLITDEQGYADTTVELLRAYNRAFSEDPKQPNYLFQRNITDLAIALDILYDKLPADIKNELFGKLKKCLNAATIRKYYRMHSYEMGSSLNGRPSDWGAISAGGFVMLYLFFEEGKVRAEAPELAAAMEMMNYIADYCISPEGHLQPGNGYIAGDFGEYFTAALALQRNGIDIFKHPHLKQISNWLIYEYLPGIYALDNRNQSQGVLSLSPTLVALAQQPNDLAAQFLINKSLGPEKRSNANPDGSALALLCRAKIEPVELQEMAKCFYSSSMGTVFSKNTWRDLDTSMNMSMESPVMGHTHPDKGHFTFYHRGIAMAADSGVAKLRASDHNSVFINGVGQLEPQNMTDAVIRAQISGNFADVTDIDLTPAYNFLIKNTIAPGKKLDWAMPDIGTGLPYVWSEEKKVKQVRRNIIFVRTPLAGYAVICDKVQQGQTPANYTWQMLSALAPEIKTNEVVLHSRNSGNYYQVIRDNSKVIFSGNIPAAGKYNIWALARTAPDLRNLNWYMTYQIGNLGSFRNYLQHCSMGWVWIKLSKTDKVGEWDLPAGSLNVNLIACKGAQFAKIVATTTQLTPGLDLGNSNNFIEFKPDNSMAFSNDIALIKDEPAVKMLLSFIPSQGETLQIKAAPKTDQPLLALISATLADKIAADFKVIMMPFDSSDKTLQIKHEKSGTTIVKHDEVSDYIITAPETNLGIVRVINGKVVSYLIAGGNKLEFNGEVLFDAGDKIVSAVNDGENLNIDCSASGQFKFIPLTANKLFICRSEMALPKSNEKLYSVNFSLPYDWKVKISEDGKTVNVVGMGKMPLKIHAPRAIKCVVNNLSVFFSRDGHGYIYPKVNEKTFLTYGNEPLK